MAKHGPTPQFASAAEYQRTVEEMISAGVMLDEAMVYWYARPSAKYPTVEVRIGDVCATVDEAVLIAALVRGLVATAIEDVQAGVEPPPIRDCVLSAAHWRAAHDGMDGALVDPKRGLVRPAWEVVDELFATVKPAPTRHGDLGRVHETLAQLRRHGCGAARQRRLHRSTGDIRTVLDILAEPGTDHREPNWCT